MGKKNKVIAKAQKAAINSVKPKADNPFDKFANARKKHDVLNRKVKGEDRNVGRARAKVIVSLSTLQISLLNCDYFYNRLLMSAKRSC